MTRRWAALAIVLQFGSHVVTTEMAAQTGRFTSVGSIPIAAELIRAQGDRAYLAAGGTLTVVDISHPEMARRRVTWQLQVRSCWLHWLA